MDTSIISIIDNQTINIITGFLYLLIIVTLILLNGVKVKKIIFIISIILIISAFLIFYFSTQNNKIKILYANVDQNSISKIKNHLNMNNEISLEFTEYIDHDINNFDLFITENLYDILHNRNLFSSLDSDHFNVMPSAVKRLGLIENSYLTVPIQLDHIEITIRKDIFNSIKNSFNEITLPALLDTLKEFSSDTVFPLMIAGNDPSSFIDFISLLVITYCGYDGYNNLLTHLNETKDFNELLNTPLGNDRSLQFILDTLVQWRRDKLLHTEWLQFTKETVKDFTQDKLSGSLIMRLSEHRTYPTRVIQKFQSIEFPNDRDSIYASDVLMIPTLCSIPEKSNNKKISISLIKSLLNKDVQRNFTEDTGLAPVHSTAHTLDIQSSNVRYWAASANKIASVYNNAENEEVLFFIEECKSYLIRNK